MMRRLIAIMVGVFYVATAALVVDRTGDAHRRSLRHAEPAARPSGELSEPPQPSPNVVTPKTTGAATSTSISAPDRAPVPAIPSVAPAPPPVVADTPKPVRPGSESVALSVPKPATPKPATEAVDSIWKSPIVKKKWDVSSLSAADELQLGAEIHAVIAQLAPILDDGRLRGRMKEAAEPFLKNRRRPEIDYKFFVLDTAAVNAFSHPGGYVYVSRGLFDLVGGDDDDCALQFAIGHEIAHVDQRHAIKCLLDPGVMRIDSGTVEKICGMIIPRGYLTSEKSVHEYEADEWVSIQMRLRERTQREILMFLRKLDDYAKSHGFEYGDEKPVRGESPLENHYRSARAARYRVRNLIEFMVPASRPPAK
jgi:hypothetical protein